MTATTWLEADVAAMRRALAVAEQGRGRVHPNPMVGCVITDASGHILAEGAHTQYGNAHAEVNALATLTSTEIAQTLYVTLEPCSHHGKTPPCVEALLATKIQRIVIATPDPNPKVSGQGIAALKQAGRDVIVGVCQDEAISLNEAFFWHIQHNTPFVVLKHALTLDGATATGSGHSQWITNPRARQFAHELRGQSDAILSTARSVIADNSQLTVRDAPLPGRPPKRIILDRTGQLTPDQRLFETAEHGGDILLFTHQDKVKPLQERFKDFATVSIVGLPGHHSDPSELCLDTLLADLGSAGITQLMVECGGTLAGELLQRGLINKLWLLYGGLILADSSAKPAFKGTPKNHLLDGFAVDIRQCQYLDGNVAIEAYPRH